MMRLFAPSVLLTLCSAQVAAQQGIVRGQVLDRSDRPVMGAEVVLHEAGRTERTDSLGRYVFRAVRGGEITLRIRALGFASQIVSLRLESGTEAVRLITLDPTESVQALPGVGITAPASSGSYRLQGFDRRRQTGRGQYLTEDDIIRLNASTVAEAVRSLRGVIYECGGGAGCYVRMARAPMRCLPDYIVDGQVMNDFGSTTPIRDVIAMEVYSGPGDIAGEFAGRNAGCGVIVLWTRTGPRRR